MKSKDNFFTSKDQVKTIDTFRLIYLIVGLVSFFFTELGRFVYRPFIYENNLSDFGIADSIGNLGGIVVQIFIGLAIFNPPFKKGFRLFGFFVMGYIVYEILQPILPRGVFDWTDIYGTLIGGVIAVLLYIIIHAGVKQNNTIYKLQ